MQDLLLEEEPELLYQIVPKNMMVHHGLRVEL